MDNVRASLDANVGNLRSVQAGVVLRRVGGRPVGHLAADRPPPDPAATRITTDSASDSRPARRPGWRRPSPIPGGHLTDNDAPRSRAIVRLCLSYVSMPPEGRP